MNNSVEDVAPDGAGSLESVKKIPALTASIVTVVGALAAGIIWIFGYFATQHQLQEVRLEVKKARCVADLNIEMVKFHQAFPELIRAYNYYLGESARLTNQEKRYGLTDQQRVQLSDANQQIKSLRKKQDISTQRIPEIRKILQSGQILLRGNCNSGSTSQAVYHLEGVGFAG